MVREESGMGIAAWKELCMDTTDGDALGRFWSDVAGLAFRPDGGPGDLVGTSEGHGVAMCRVPEEKSAKHRVHLDVYAASVEELTGRGAAVVLPAEESGFGWTVMTDPEGGEFCAFLREPGEVPEYRVHGLVVDSADPAAIARWWHEVLGGELRTDAGHGWWWLEDVPGLPISTMDFVPVPEPKSVKNRIHWDVYGTVDTLRDKGATLLRAQDADSPTAGPDAIGWDVMADPEGNEFCVFTPRG
jgi:predicted enzyme related to lactoylglutathione lyase